MLILARGPHRRHRHSITGLPPAGAALLLALLQQRVDAAHGDRQHGVGRYHLQPHAAERDEPALWPEFAVSGQRVEIVK
jgi:hypothetical protein